MSVVSATGSIREEIASELNESESDNTDRYTNYINLCLYDLALTYPYAPFLYTSADFTVSSGTRQYNISAYVAGFEKMISIIDPVGDVRLAYLTEHQFDSLQPSASETGIPSVYTIHRLGVSASMELYPSPDSGRTLRMRARILPPTVSVGSAVPPVPIKYSEAFVAYGTMRGLKARGQYVEAREAERRYNELKSLMRQDLDRMSEEPMRIKSVREFTPSNQVYGDEIRNLFWAND